MTRTAQSTAQDAGHRPFTSSGTMPSTGFRVKWDRTAIALVALLAVISAVGTGIATALGAGLGLVAGVAALVAVAAVVGLRFLAVRDRKKRANQRIDQAFDEAMNSSQQVTGEPPFGPHGTAGAAGATGPARPFDAARPSTARPSATSNGAATSAGVASDRGAAEHTEHTENATGRQHVAEGAGHEAGHEGAGHEGAQTSATEQGAPASTVPSVPRPTYLDAPETHRAHPEPLTIPEPPLASPGTKLKSGVSAEYRAKVEATANRTLDLDKVLERRRAV
ncbi:hypothetical protein [Citricoccus sp. GCM10030269]|uniref:hypothetical protein n=1 Tax=Citricoccus sp. GCM10030269 TaxID=3273388 RepID=UPI003611A538